MNRSEAVQYIHDRHPHVIGAPGDDIDLGPFHLEMFWFQGYVSDCMESRSRRSVKRSLETMEHVAQQGDRQVRASLMSDFLQHIVFSPEIEWARSLMSPTLAAASRRLEQAPGEGAWSSTCAA